MGVGTLRLSRRAHFFFLLDLLLVSWTCLGRSWNGRLPPRGGGGRERGKRNGTEDGAAGEGSGLVSLFFMLLFFSLDNSISPTGPNLDAAATLRPR